MNRKLLDRIISALTAFTLADAYSSRLSAQRRVLEGIWSDSVANIHR